MWRDQLDRVLKSWLGTPYAPSAWTRGCGVDCRYFVMGVLDELYHISLPLPPPLPPEVGIHDGLRALKTVKDIAGRYPNDIIDGMTESGDVVLIRAGGLQAPSHCLIAGKDTRTLWHSVRGSGVCFTSFDAVKDKVVRIYRPREKTTW